MQFILNVVFSVQCTALPPTPHMASLMESLHVARTSKEVSSVIHIFVPAGAYRQTEDLRPAGQDQQVLPPPHHLPSRDIVKKRIMHSPHQLSPPGLGYYMIYNL